jgi:hypothetical protein
MKTGSAITGNTNTSVGGGVFVDSGTFTMEGGEIKGNTADDGGGVYLSGGIFNMAGGTIYGSDAVGNLRNTTTSSLGEGAALRCEASAQAYRGTLSAGGTFTQTGVLSTNTNTTIKVVNGALAP